MCPGGPTCRVQVFCSVAVEFLLSFSFPFSWFVANAFVRNDMLKFKSVALLVTQSDKLKSRLQPSASAIIRHGTEGQRALAMYSFGIAKQSEGKVGLGPRYQCTSTSNVTTCRLSSAVDLLSSPSVRTKMDRQLLRRALLGQLKRQRRRNHNTLHDITAKYVTSQLST